ncbi:MAG: phosphoglucomutase/phosphomannomutase family protein [Thermoanaerobaculia bacterium]
MRDEFQFGTDGWRAVIADRFTFENVRRVADAIGLAAREFEAPDGVDANRLVVGYDRRFLSADFAYEAALTLSKAGYDVILSDAPTPSQTVSHAVKSRKLLGGVIITASHNPAVYNGIKFKGWYGGSALPSMYEKISESLGMEDRRGGGSVTKEDILTPYVDAVREIVDVEKIRESGLRILHDPIHGAGSPLVARILHLDGPVRELGKTVSVRTIRADVNPAFGGVNPEPIPENLGVTLRLMARGEYHLAICNDGDADRLGVIDEGGRFVSPHQILSLLALYLVRDKGMRGDLVKTFSTTRLIEKIATALGVRLHETKIGFKYIVDLMLENGVLLGGEESGGIGFGAFLPERDGILSGLLVAECLAERREPLSRVVSLMEEEFGAAHYDRRDLHEPRTAIEHFLFRVERGDLDNAFGMPMTRRESLDGVKLNFEDGSWILFRKSGTEPLIRIYCESPVQDQVDGMLDVAVRELEQPVQTG